MHYNGHRECYWGVIMRPALLCIFTALAACSSAGTPAPSTLSGTRPGPLLMQYVGEYDATGASGLSQLTLHVDRNLEATISGGTTAGTFVAAGTSGANQVRAMFVDPDGNASAATFGPLPSSAGGPSRAEVELAGFLGNGTLVAPWVGGDESMCRASGGQWTDDDADPSTGLYCTCPSANLYLPSRGGCVGEAAGAGDPARLPASAEMRAASGHYAGDGPITDLALDDHGSYHATVDGHADVGTWWDDGAPNDFALTSATQASWATLESGALRLDLGDRTETLHRSR